MASASSQMKGQGILGCLSLMLDKPHPNDVIIGRGRSVQSAPGNVRFRKINNSFLDAYSAARQDKGRKTAIISEVLDSVIGVEKEKDGAGGPRTFPGHGFVKSHKPSGLWVVCEIATAKSAICAGLQRCP